MTNIIDDFAEYTPMALRDLLMASISQGDANELHSACIALCSIAGRLAQQIRQLEGHVAQLENRLSAVERENAKRTRNDCQQSPRSSAGCIGARPTCRSSSGRSRLG